MVRSNEIDKYFPLKQVSGKLEGLMTIGIL